jgi:thiol:disulfide interchange protein DsbC
MKTLFVSILFLLSAANTALAENHNRWYSSDQIQKGSVLFKNKCAECHGQNAEATINWKQTDADGKYPPPPLNGTGHAWHHDLAQLRESIQKGGKQLGGTMPAFKDKLSSDQVDQAIAYFQSKWPDDLYQKWATRFEVDSLPPVTGTQQPANQSITRLLKQRLGTIELDEPRQTAVSGVWQVKLKNRYVYLIQDGQYALIGDLIDLKNGQNLTEKQRRVSVLESLKSYHDDELVVFYPGGEIKATLDIFTDTTCPYCKKLHQELPKLLKSGIKVRYLPYARGGRQGPGYQELKSVWCADDRIQAMNDTFENTESLPTGNCKMANIVDKAYDTGNQIGVTGTPALFKQNGEKIEGYVPFKKLVPMLLNQ